MTNKTRFKHFQYDLYLLVINVMQLSVQNTKQCTRRRDRSCAKFAGLLSKRDRSSVNMSPRCTKTRAPIHVSCATNDLIPTTPSGGT